MAEWPVKVDLSVKVSEETSAKIADALLDLILPVTATAGLLGQYVQQRRKVLAVIFEKAFKKAQQADQEIHAPPPKFLLEFADRASREDLESDLIDMWANLLAEASTDYNSPMISFCDIISRLGRDEAEALMRITEGMKRLFVSKAQSPMSHTRELFLAKLKPFFVDRVMAPTKAEAEQIFKEIVRDYGFDNGKVVLSFCIPESENPPAHFNFEIYVTRQVMMESRFYLEYPISLEILRREGLIEIREATFYSKHDPSNLNPFIVGYAELTNFGLEFFETCTAQKE